MVMSEHVLTAELIISPKVGRSHCFKCFLLLSTTVESAVSLLNIALGL